MRHRTLAMLALTVVVALTTATALLAQDNATSTGRITNIDTSAGTITMTTAGGSTETVSTDSQSRDMSNGRTINLPPLKTGDQVTVTYRTSGNTKTATHVDVVSSPNYDTTTRPGTANPPDTYGTLHDTTTTPGTDTYGSRPSSTYERDHTMDTNTNTMDTTHTTDHHLPRTGSPLPMLGLAAGLFAGAGLTLAGFRRFAS
jgi:Cu/Ag efflux protein CusF